MSRRQLQHFSLAGSFVKRKAKGSRWLEDIDKVNDWAPVVAVLSKLHSSSVGAPAFPPLLMFKILLLQQWYCLSEDGVEAAVDDRLSFHRFCGFPLDQTVPDHATIWRFRESLGKLGLAEAAGDTLNAQLEHRGLIVKRGTLVDATIIAAAAAPPPPKTGVVSEADPDASWTTKNGTSTFGYNVQISVDEGSNLIGQIEGTSTDVYDSPAAAALVQGDERAYYADKGYDSDDLRRSLKDRGIEPCVMYKAHRNTPLTTAQTLLNLLFSGQRARSARLRHDEAPLRAGPGLLLQAEVQSRPHTTRCLRYQPDARSGPRNNRRRHRGIFVLSTGEVCLNEGIGETHHALNRLNRWARPSREPRSA